MVILVFLLQHDHDPGSKMIFSTFLVFVACTISFLSVMDTVSASKRSHPDQYIPMDMTDYIKSIPDDLFGKLCDDLEWEQHKLGVVDVVDLRRVFARGGDVDSGAAKLLYEWVPEGAHQGHLYLIFKQTVVIELRILTDGRLLARLAVNPSA